MSLQCQKIEIKKLPFYASDITNFTSAVCAVVLEMSSVWGGEPIFKSWANSYSADLYSSYTTVLNFSSSWINTDDPNVNSFVYSNSANILQVDNVVNSSSGNWNSVYNSYNSASAGFLTNSSADVRYVKLSGDVMTGGLSSPSLSTNNLYVAGSTINFFDGTGNIIETLKSNDVGNFKSNYTLTNSRSAKWEDVYSKFSEQSANNFSVYNNVQTNSGNWNYQGTDIKSLTSNWEATYNNFSVQSSNNLSVYSVFNSNSSNYNSVYNTVNSNSSTTWNYQGNDVKSLTSNWQNTYNTVQTNSGNWNYQGNDIKSLTSNWESTYNNFNVQSSNNLSVYNTVNSNSATTWNYQGNDLKALSSNWENTYNTVQTYSAAWIVDSSVDVGVRALTSNWENTYNTVKNNSGDWNYQGTDIKALTSNWQNTYSNFSVQSANNISVYNTFNSNSGNYNSVYNTVQTNSATWGSGSSPQTLSFNESNAELTISDGNTVSLSSLNVSYLSALYDVSIPSPVDGQVLTYSSLLDKWTNGFPSSASGATGYYGSFYDERNQSITTTTSAYVVAMSGTFESNGISLSSNNIVFQYAGTYEIIYSIQIVNTHNNQEDIQVWFTRNGIDIPISNSVFTINAKSGNETGKIVMVTPFIVTVAAGDIIGLKWNASNVGVTIDSLPANTTPSTPSAPGVIVTVKQVTNVQVPGSVTGNYLPLSGGTLTGAVSTTDIFYTNGGNSTQWNSSYNTVNSNSATWGTGGGSGGGGIIYYFNQATLAQSPTTNIPITAHQLGRSGLSAQTTYTSPEISQAQYDLVAGFLTDVLDPNVDAIPGGIWDFNIWGYSNATANNLMALQALVYTYDSVNAPVLLSTSDVTTLTNNGQFIQRTISCLVPQTTISLSARIYVEFRAKATSSGKTVTLAFGDATPSHIHTTLPSVGGTGLVKVIDGITQNPASLLVDADVASGANISQSKINGLTDIVNKANSTYNTVNVNSATNWNYQGTDIKALTANWNATFTQFSTQSSNNLSVYSQVNSKSANWDTVYNTVYTTSGSWGGGGTIDTDVRALTGNWQNTYTAFSTQSANNLSVYSTVQANSGTSTWGFSRVAQVVSVQDATQVTSAITIPLDDTIPQSNEGTAYPQLDLTITPTNTNSILLIEVQLAVYVSAAMGANACLFRDAETNALATVSQQFNNVGHSAQIRLRYFLTAGSTSSQTFKIRIGRTAGTTQTVYVNDYINAYYGGTQRSSMTITEIRP